MTIPPKVIIQDSETHTPRVYVREDDQLHEVNMDDLVALIESYSDPLDANQAIEIAELSAAKWVIYARENALIGIDQAPSKELTYVQLYWTHSDKIAGDLSQAIVELVRITADAGKIDAAISLSDHTGFVGSASEAKEYIAKRLILDGDPKKARGLLEEDAKSRPLFDLDLFVRNIQQANKAKPPQPDLSLENLRTKLISSNSKEIENNQAELVADAIIQLAHSTNDDTKKIEIYREYAKAMGAIGKLAIAFQYHQPDSPEEFIEDVAKWRNSLEAIKAGVSLQIMQRTIPIIATIRPDWRKINEILS